MLPEYLYPKNPLLLIAPLAVGLLLDAVYPFHRGFMLTIHPVHTSYIMALKLAPPYSSRIRGIATWFATVCSHIVIYAVLLYAAWRLNTVVWILASSYIVKTSISIRLLVDTVKRVDERLRHGDLDGARCAVSGIVRRDVRNLGPGHIASAAIESLFESLVDGIASPLFYYILLGPIGALFQRLVNTLDGALGFKTLDRIESGWFSAKMDTYVNFIPARLAAILIVFSAPIVKSSVKKTFRVYKTFKNATESINAGHPLAAAAGALRIKLEKRNHYTIGYGDLPIYSDVDKAVKLFLITLAELYTLSILSIYTIAFLDH